MNVKSENGLVFGLGNSGFISGSSGFMIAISLGALTLIFKFGVVGAPILGKLIFKAVFWISLGLTAASTGTAEIGSITLLFKAVVPYFPPSNVPNLLLASLLYLIFSVLSPRPLYFPCQSL